MITWLSGKKTVLTGALMVLMGSAELLGIDLPGVEPETAGSMITNGFAFIFARFAIAKGTGA